MIPARPSACRTLLCAFFLAGAALLPARLVAVAPDSHDAIRQINAARQKAGVPALTMDAALESAAGQLARETAKDAAPNPARWQHVLMEKGITRVAVWETHGHHPSGATAFVSDVLARPRSRSALTDPRYRKMGLGAYRPAHGSPLYFLLLTDSPATASATAPSATVDTVAYARELMRRINTEREKRHMRPLVAPPALEKAARIRAREITTHYTNIRPNGTFWLEVLNENHITYTLSSSTMIRGAKTPAAFMQRLLKGKDRILTHAEYNQGAAGVAVGADKRLYWYVIYITQTPSHPPAKTAAKNAAAPGVTISTAPPAMSSPAFDPVRFKRELVSLVNATRTQSGMSSLVTLPSLEKVASVRANEIGTLFSHTRPDGTTFPALFRVYRIIGIASGENIAAGPRSAQEAMMAWMASPSHKDNILNPRYTHIGVAVEKGNAGQLYWTQIFLATDKPGRSSPP
ncbi:MAG: CAP domain-containing protein [Burkholderiaceae bacterium]|jgi:uncharacterized protein YkwD|nr:CAP domain-containing protein [Burkholderiaceae bacterium]